MQTFLNVGLSNAVFVAVLALVLLPAARLLRRPALTHALCLLILVKLVTPPVWHVPLDWPDAVADAAPAVPPSPTTPVPHATATTPASPIVPKGEMEASRMASADTHQPTTAASPSPARERYTGVGPEYGPAVVPTIWAIAWAAIDWPAALMWLWLAGSAGCLASVVLRVRALRRLLRFAEPAPDDVQRRAGQLAVRFGLAAAPRVWLAPGSLCPMLVGLPGRAGVYVSAGLWARLADAQRDALLLHELAHFRRRDHWVRPLEVLVTILYWWHPAVWWTRRALREAEEQCCDAWVVWGMPAGSARDYATALLDVVDFTARARRPNAVPLLASGMGEFRHLKRRLTMIQRSSIPRTLTWSGVAVVCALAAVLLPLSPMAAQSESAAESEWSAGDRVAGPMDGAEDEDASDSAEAEAARARRRAEAADPDAKATFQAHAQLMSAEVRLRQAEQRAKAEEAAAAEQERFAQRLAAAGGGEPVLEIFALRTLQAREALRIFDYLLRKAEVTAISDERTNSLILQGAPGRVDLVREELRRYDRGENGVPAAPAPQPPEVVRPVDAARRLRLLDVASFKDGIDTRGRAVRFIGKDGEVVVTPGDSVLVELPAPTRELQWSAGESTEKVGTPADGPQFDHVMCEWDKAGRLTWTLYSSPWLGGPDDAKRRAEAQLAAIERRLAELEKRRAPAPGGLRLDRGAAEAPPQAPPPGADGVTVRSGGRGHFEATDVRSGKLLWTHDTGGEPLFPPVVHDGRVFVGTQDGKLLVFELTTGKRLSDAQPQGRR